MILVPFQALQGEVPRTTVIKPGSSGKVLKADLLVIAVFVLNTTFSFGLVLAMYNDERRNGGI